MAPEASPVEDVSAYPTLAEWLAAAPFTLAMASSYFGFFAHAGMLQALAEAGLRPAKVCGSSSGSIIAALYSGGLDPQTTLPDLLLSLKPTDILTPFWRGIAGLGVGVFKINEKFLAQTTPVSRLEKGVCPVALSTFDVLSRKTVTWSTGDTHTIVAASCSIPGIMQPVWIDGRVHVDGGCGDLLGLASCSAEERVLSVDLHTIGLTTTRKWHVRLFGDRPSGSAAALHNCTRLQLRGLPMCGPTSMGAKGPLALQAGRAAMREALTRRANWGGERILGVDVPSARA